jgi:hypothetical protein
MQPCLTTNFPYSGIQAEKWTAWNQNQNCYFPQKKEMEPVESPQLPPGLYEEIGRGKVSRF